MLVDFWTYTCINWLRTLAYVRAWAEKYEDHGLVVVGVHTPEFPFERDVDNVRRAAKDMDVEYPIALDSDYAVWRRVRATTTGRPSTSPTRRAGSGTTSSARAGTTSASGSSSSCCARPGARTSPTTWSPSRRTGSRRRPTGTNLRVARDLPRLRAGPELRVSGRRRARTSPHLRRARSRWSSTSGRSPGTGRSRRGRAC